MKIKNFLAVLSVFVLLLTFCREKAKFNRIELTFNDTVRPQPSGHFIEHYNIDLYGDTLPEMSIFFYRYFSPMSSGANNNSSIRSYDDYKFATEQLYYKQFKCNDGYPPVDSIISKSGAKLFEFGDSLSAVDLNLESFADITYFSGPPGYWQYENSECECLDVWLGSRNKYVVFYHPEKQLIGYLEISVLDYTDMIIHKIVIEKGDVIKIK